jgi:hypothetical protein
MRTNAPKIFKPPRDATSLSQATAESGKRACRTIDVVASQTTKQNKDFQHELNVVHSKLVFRVSGSSFQVLA